MGYLRCTGVANAWTALPAQITAYGNYVIMPVPPQVKLTGPDVVVSYLSSSNQLYTFETRTNLTTASWQDFTNHVPGNGAVIMVTNFGAANGPAHFYRVKVE